MKEFIIGTRGSALALWQANTVKGLLEQLGAPARIQVIKTSGDKHQSGPLADHGGKGLFVKELEIALEEGSVDLAVHSLKDVPCVLTEAFALAAFLPRADPRDCLIAPAGMDTISALPPGTRVGSCSPRRLSQALHVNPALTGEDLRGNVETRLGKVRSGVLGATFLAKAGLDRLGISEPDLIHPLPAEEMLPAAGQGIVAIEIRANRDDVHQVLSRLDDALSRRAAEAEREVVRNLGGTCVSPIAVHAVPEADRISIRAVVGDSRGKQLLRESTSGGLTSHITLARSLANSLIEQGAREIMEDRKELLL